LPPFFEHRFRVVWSKIENCLSINEISHPAVRAILTFLGQESGLEIHHDGDLPARSGLGSSSAFAVGLLHALYALQGRTVGPLQLAQEAIYIETQALHEVGGVQDQVATAFGGFNYIEFNQSGRFTISPIDLPAYRLEALHSHLVLIYPGILRPSQRSSNSPPYQGKRHELHLIRQSVDEALAILTGNQPISDLGALMSKAWFAKRRLGEDITNASVDAVYAEAMEAGALGGKLLGAGGGGFMLFVVPPERQPTFLNHLKRFVHVPFEFDETGSQIILSAPGEEHPPKLWKIKNGSTGWNGAAFS
jgi:D-glycero-alpha-D-manno-heptose-7-phosphate kinase